MGCLATDSQRRRAAGLAALAVLAAFVLAAPAVAQAAYQPEFDAEAVAFRAAEGTAPRLDVYTRVPYPNLRFVRRDDGFTARYTVSVAVHRADRNGRPQGLLRTRSWEHTVRAPTYAATQEDAMADHAVHALDLPPGAYALRVTLEDGTSARSVTREIALEVPTFREPVALSDVLLADRYDAATQRLTPNVPAAVSSDQPTFTLFYEVYARQPERLRVRYEVRRAGEERRRRSALAGLLGRRGREPEPSPPLYAVARALELRPGRNPTALSLETGRFGVGDYEATVRVERGDGTVLAERTRSFAVRWTGLSDQIRDLDAAIAQLRYVAKDRELRAMQRAASPEERLRLFQEFWDKRDPSPGNRRNERMEEYYYRIAYANRAYGNRPNRGWETEQGEVYVRFGEPDAVERHPFPANAKPHQIWYYHRIGRRFIFVDESGTGDYRLLVPIWDERTRM
jgi:GWxTD domain-containing protein